jgi:hypothetical protein
MTSTSSIQRKKNALLLFGMLIGTTIGNGCVTSEQKWDEQTLKQLAQSTAELNAQLKQGTVAENDLLLLTLAVRNPKQAPIFCEKVESTAALEKCRQVIGRPHLQLSAPQTNDVQHNDVQHTDKQRTNIYDNDSMVQP